MNKLKNTSALSNKFWIMIAILIVLSVIAYTLPEMNTMLGSYLNKPVSEMKMGDIVVLFLLYNLIVNE